MGNNKNIWDYAIDLREVDIQTGCDALKMYRGFDEGETTDTDYNPFLMNDMNRAVDLFISIISNPSHPLVLICGDYDCDGLCATSILVKGLAAVYDVSKIKYHIPNRLTDGYGLSENTAQKIIDNHVGLVITVDNGISATDAIKKLKDAGIPVIVTDHHQVPKDLPEADAIINCHREDNTYPFEDLCGAAVAYKFLCAVSQRMKKAIDNKSAYEEMVMLATLADSVPLAGENRAIVKRGLALFNRKETALSQGYFAGQKKETTVTGKDLSFNLIPKINAAGRLGYNAPAMGLFASTNVNGVNYYLQKLESMNTSRKEKCKAIVKDVEDLLVNDNDFDLPIVLYAKTWSKGLVGIPAITIAQKYARPTFLLELDEHGMLHGSARSYGGFNIFQALEHCSSALDSFGGHPGAGGLSLHIDKISEFKRLLYEYTWENPFENAPKRTADAYINLNYLTDHSLFNSVVDMDPFGEGNPEPLFMADVKINKIWPLGSTHVKLEVTDGIKTAICLAFNCKDLFNDSSEAFHINDNVTVVFTLNKNEWNGKVSIEMFLEDIFEQ